MVKPQGITRALARAAPALTTQYSYFLERQERIITMAARVLGGRSSAERWISKPARGLDYQPPCGILSTPAGFAEVETLILRIEYGVYI